MTEEEQQAYYAKREQELLDMCRIKTREQFLDECRKAGIDLVNNYKTQTNSGLATCRYSSYCLNPDRYREIAHSFIGTSQWVEYKPFYLTCCSEACGVRDNDDKEIDKSEFVDILL